VLSASDGILQVVEISSPSQMRGPHAGRVIARVERTHIAAWLGAAIDRKCHLADAESEGLTFQLDRHTRWITAIG